MQYSSRTRRPLAAVLLALALPVAAQAVVAGPGDADSGFDTDGKVLGTVNGFQGEWRTLKPLADGRVLAVGTGYWLNVMTPATGHVAMYTSTGALDTGFGGGDGIYPHGSGLASAYFDAVQLADGKFMVLGRHLTGQVMLVRLTAEGALDTSFGTSGVVTHAMTSDVTPWRIARTYDGKFIVAATVLNQATVKVLRLNADGSLDSSFDSDGVRDLAFTGYSFAEQVPVALAVQPDNKVLVGASETGSSFDFLVYRLLTNGTNDTTWDNSLAPGPDGKAYFAAFIGTNYNTQDQLYDMALQPDGSLLMAGATRATAGDTFVGIIGKFTAAGRIDYDFGPDNTGFITTDFAGHTGEHFYGIDVQDDGAIVVTGTAQLNGSHPQYNRFLVARYTADGALDTAFSSDGYEIFQPGTGDTCDHAFAGALAADGDIYLAGESVSGQVAGGVCNAPGNFALVRRLGSADTTAPAPYSASPADGATGVATSSTVSALYDGVLNLAAIDNNSLTLQCNGSAVTGEVALDEELRRLVFTPAAALPAGVSCTATSAATVADPAGNVPAGSTSWTFTTAAAAVVKYKVTVLKAGTGKGTVKATTGAINCGSTCSGKYSAGSKVVLKAVPAKGDTFGGWKNCPKPSGTTCTIPKVTKNLSVTATFKP